MINNVFLRALPTAPIEELTAHPYPLLHFISQFMQNADFFPAWLMPWTPTQVFSCKICKIFKSTAYFEGMTASHIF